MFYHALHNSIKICYFLLSWIFLGDFLEVVSWPWMTRPGRRASEVSEVLYIFSWSSALPLVGLWIIGKRWQVRNTLEHVFPGGVCCPGDGRYSRVIDLRGGQCWWGYLTSLRQDTVANTGAMKEWNKIFPAIMDADMSWILVATRQHKIGSDLAVPVVLITLLSRNIYALL